MRYLSILVIFLTLFGCFGNKSKVTEESVESKIVDYSVKDDIFVLLKKDQISVMQNNSLLLEKKLEDSVTSYVVDKRSNFIMGLANGYIVEFDVDKKDIKYVEKFFEPITILNLTSDDKYLIAISKTNKILIIDRATKAMGMGAYDEKIFGVRISSDYTKIFVHFEDRIEVLDFADKKVIETLNF